MNSEAISVATQSVRAKTEPHEAVSAIARVAAVVSRCIVYHPWSYGTPRPAAGRGVLRGLYRPGGYELRFPRKKSVSFPNGIRFTRS